MYDSGSRGSRDGTILARLYIGALLALALVNQSTADNRYDVTATPAWVVPAELPASKSPDPDLGKGGANYLVVDHQIRLEAVELDYARFVTQLTNVSGIEDNSQITIDFDPKIERLHLHSVLIRRGTQSIDQLRHGRVRVIQRENSLEDQLVDGALTFHLVMSDVRVGDIVDYSYTLERRNAEWGSRNFGRLPTQWSVPVEFLRIRLLSSPASTLKTFSHPAETPKAWTAAGLNIVEWSKANVAALRNENDAPSWFQQYGAVEYSQFSSWGQIVEAAMPLYAVVGAPSSEMRELTTRFAADDATDAERVTEVMKFVQEQIRYTGIEEGEGAYRPTPPNEVLARRYGDCKDKTLLAVTLLRALGIEAAPALVSTRWKAEVANHLPSPALMNHVVVRAVVGGQIYWFDATSTAQGGRLANFTQASFGKALVIAPGVATLEPMKQMDSPTPLIRSRAIFDLRGGLFAESSLNVTTTYSDAEADRMRRRLRTKGTGELAENYLHYYKGQYGAARSTGALGVTDKLEQNELTITESYRIKDVFETDKQGRQRFYVNADTITDALSAPDLPERTTPLALDFPNYLQYQIQILLPTAWDVDVETVKVDTPNFQYASTVGYADKVITLDYTFKALTDHVPVAQLPDHIKQLEQARDDTYFHISRNSNPQTANPQQGRFWALKLVALLAALFLMLRFGRFALTVQALLAATLNRVRSGECSESEVPESERLLLQSLDHELMEHGFEPMSVVRSSPLYTRYDKPEYVRAFHRSSPPTTAYVSRHHTPEYGAYARVWFEADFADGTRLQTTDGASDPGLAAPNVLAEAVGGASVSQLIERHDERIKRLEGNGGVVVNANFLGSAASRVSAGCAAVRAEWLRRGWIRASADADLDRFTIKGAFQLARSVLRTQSTGAAGTALLKSSQGATSTERAARAAADFLAVWHFAKAPRAAPGANWAQMGYCALLAAVPLGIFAAVSGPLASAAMVAALLLHEAAHLWALGKRRASPGLLFFMPFAGVIQTASRDERSLVQRVSVILAGPLSGLLTGVILLVADVLWPGRHIRDAASIFIGFNGLLLIAYPGTDGNRIVAAITAPGSLMRPMAQVLSVAALVSVGFLAKSQFLFTVGFILAVWIVTQLPTFNLIRKIARQVSPDSNWDSTAHRVFLVMTAAEFGRWAAPVRQMRGVAIANDLARPTVSRMERIQTLVGYGCCALLAICAALRASP